MHTAGVTGPCRAVREMSGEMHSVDRALRDQLLKARTGDSGWGYEPGRTPRLEPTCWALLALRTSHLGAGRILAEWPAPAGALLEQRTGLPNWSFHALALATRLVLGDAPVAELKRLADALVEARGVTLQPSPIQRQDNRLQGWSWIDGTFSWAEPTAWAVFALKKCHALGIVPKGASMRILDGESLLQDRVCAGGGWNYGNSNVFNKNLPAYIPTTAIALLALQDRRRRGLRARQPPLPRRASPETLVYAGPRTDRAGVETTRPLDLAHPGSAPHVAHQPSADGYCFPGDGSVCTEQFCRR